MIITKKFVLLNFPKNGSTYIREMIKQIHGVDNKKSLTRIINKLERKGVRVNKIRELLFAANGLEERLFPSNMSLHTYDNNIVGPHTTYSQIPLKHREKPVLISIRNPFERFVSLYEFGHWKGESGFKVNPKFPEIKQEFPDFPEISFNDYYKLMSEYGANNMVRNPNKMKVDIGPYSLQFLKFVMPDPENYIYQLTDEDITENKIKNDIPSNICFIHTENLNEELYEFLAAIGYNKSKVKKIIDQSNPINSKKKKWKRTHFIEYLNEDIITDIKEKEKLIFYTFPEYKNSI
ncbi:MAG: sulfotransferase domain-containing protein [Candidatus Woesearchaeota archaeon]